jgi:hypothetical protein
MPKRALRIVKNSHPVTAVCESCERVFVSRAEDATMADNEIRNLFDAHACEPIDASHNTPLPN